jgi:hypothetical protein
MRIKVEGCPDIHFIPFIENSLEYYAESLIKEKRIRNNIAINVIHVPDLKTLASVLPVGYNTQKKPRKFNIEVHTGLGSRRTLETLAHEMVHVKQYVYGEIEETLMAWKGKKYDSDANDYYSWPWEIEAHGKELGLYSKFVVKYSLWEIFTDMRNPDRKSVV